MNSASLVPGLITVAVLAGTAWALVTLLRLEHSWLQPVAIARATVQLGLLSLVLAGVITDARFVAGFLSVMVVAAAWVSSRRLAVPLRHAWSIAAIIAASSAAPATIVFALGALPLTARNLLALGGIIIGNAMTATTLAGRALAEGIATHVDEIEGWLALGATPRQAVASVARRAGSTALVPATDQTRTTGIVVLPGAFVGAVFGGAHPLDAALFQVVVLAAVLVAGGCAVAGVTGRFGAPRHVSRDGRLDRTPELRRAAQRTAT